MSKKFREPFFVTERSVAVIIGVLLASLGLVTLARNIFSSPQEFHWWASFIVLPALFFFGSAWVLARQRFSSRISLVLLGLGLIVLTVAAIFLLNLAWERWWPLMLITPALTLLILGLPNLAPAQKPAVTAWVSLLAWVGLSTLLLGLTFLAGNFQRIDLQVLQHSWGWWSIFILICALGATFNGGWLWRQSGVFNLPVLGLFLLTNTLLIVAMFEWFQVSHRIEQLPWLLITSGIWLVLYFVFINRSKSYLDLRKS